MNNIAIFKKIFLATFFIWLATYSPASIAEINNQGILDTVLTRYRASAVTWGAIITSHATWLFWILVTISMVITFGFMALRKADIGEFFAEFVKFILFVGFFWWLLLNGPGFATDIIDSLRQIGGEATGNGPSLTPSGIVDIGFDVFDRVINASSIWEPLDSALGIIISLIILVVLALVAINMLLLLISGWVLAYAGIFFLGFGGSKWTSDMAINYYKTVLGLAAQLMATVLLIGIGQDIINNYVTQMSGNLLFGEMAVILIVSITLLVLVNKVPPLIAGIITGASVGGQGIGNFGAGAAIGAAAGMATAAAVGSAAMQSMATQSAGAGSAIMAAFKEAQQNMQSGSGMFASSGSGGSDSGGGGSESSGDSGSGKNSSGLAQAMGTGAKFAADMGANLAKGMSGTVKEAMGAKADSIKESIGETMGGKIASEIQNPGAATQERQDNKDIAKAESMQAAGERSEKAAEARAFLSGSDSSGSLSAGEESPSADDGTSDTDTGDTTSSGTPESNSSENTSESSSGSTMPSQEASNLDQDTGSLNTDSTTDQQNTPAIDMSDKAAEVRAFVIQKNRDN